MITLTELQNKEVVMMRNGRRLGYIEDLEIDEKLGKITALILIERNQGVSFFNKTMERMITWEQIITIGDDIILINEWNDSQKKLPENVKL